MVVGFSPGWRSLADRIQKWRQNCEINYACAPTPTTTTKPATPTTSSAESADTVLINTARSTPDIYGVNSYYGSAQWQAYLKATTGWSSTSSSWWSTAWSNAWDFTKGLGRATGETLVSSTKSSLQAMFAPGLLVRDTIDSISASYNKYGGGWKGGYIAANEVLNPAYSLIQSSRDTINSAQAGDWQAAGYNTANTIKAAAETAVVVYTGAEAVSTVRARLASGGPGSPPADFVAGPPGSEPPVPVSQSRMAAGFSEAGFPATPTRAPGVEYTLPDLTKVRLMEASGEAPMRASFTNAIGQPINPFTGKPVQPPAPAGLTMQEWVRAVTHVVQKK